MALLILMVDDMKCSCLLYLSMQLDVLQIALRWQGILRTNRLMIYVPGRPYRECKPGGYFSNPGLRV